jgi:hypothetical protein
MEDNRKDLLIADTDELEDRCIAVKSKTSYIYCYPICPEVLKAGCKVITRDGRVVKKVAYGNSCGVNVYVGILDGQEMRWDEAGRFVGPYEDSPNDLYVAHRYWFKDWRNHIKLSHAEWNLRFETKHPTVKLPENNE